MKKKIIIVRIAFAFLLLAAIGFTFAYFTANVTGNEEAEDVIVETGTLSLLYTDGPEIILNDAYPGDYIEKTFTVENTGTLDAEYTIYIKDLINNFLNEEIVLSLTCTSYKDGEENGTCQEIENKIIQYSTSMSEETIKTNIPVEPGIIHEYKLIVLFKETNEVQNYNQGKTFSGLINIAESHEYKCAYNTYEEGTIAYKMLSDNCAYADNVSSEYVTSETGINFGAKSSDTNGKGLYYTTDLTKTQNSKRVYYYRGAVDNNYIVFANKCWKIVRTNEDGSVKLRYQGVAINNSGVYSCSTTASPLTSMAFNTKYDDNAYVGYMYPDTPTTSSILNMDNDILNKNESNIKVYLDNWYDTNLAAYSSNIADTIYCADRTISSDSSYNKYINSKIDYGKNVVFYGAFERLAGESNNNTWISRSDASPQYKCERMEDSFTKNVSIGNGKLEKAIGLITDDEVSYAGGLFNNTAGTALNNDYYLYVSSYFWTMTPGAFNGYSSDVFRVNNGTIESWGVTTSKGVFPVISINSNTKIINGNGTASNPYVVE